MLDIENSVLVVIDIQGKLASLMYQKEKFFENVVKMIKGARVLDMPIIWNEQLPDKLGPTIPEIKDVLSDLEPLPKSSFSCCRNPAFMQKLMELDRDCVFLTGMETHICVYQTALDLMESDYDVSLVADAVSSRTMENKQIGIEAIKDYSADITSVEMALFEMLRG